MTPNTSAPQPWKKPFLFLLLAAVLGSGLTLGLSQLFRSPHGGPSISDLQRLQRPTGKLTAALEGSLPDFRGASAMALPAVVHVKNKLASDMPENTPHGFFEFFGPATSSGSGVILTADGYIVTNNHVIENAQKLQVTLFDNRSFDAEVVGADPSTDLALLKIEASGLNFLSFGNSDELVVGEWVLACGNPFNLTSTVTAGIVSAKGRSIGILEDNYRIESFIQTDAAVNPGNSGGALVNTRGELVGINTAIASRTGSFVGYSFAVPVNIVRKVVDDLKQFGKVQRALLGVQIQDLLPEVIEKYKLSVTKGVRIQGVSEGSGAAAAGLQEGDIIVKVDDLPVSSASELQEQISLHRPGERVRIAYLRNGTPATTTVTLKSMSESNPGLAEASGTSVQGIGAELAPASPNDLKELPSGTKGVKVLRLQPGKLRSAGVREGFIITRVNRKPVRTPEEVEAAVKAETDGVMLEGYYPDGTKVYYAFGN